MIFALLGLALAAEPRNCAAPLSVYIEEVQTAGTELAYLCLADRDDAGPALIEALSKVTDATVGEERVSRALAIHLLQRLDRPLTGDAVRALAPADRRFLSDGVHARRGRRSPAPEHERVFAKFPWYQPDPGFTNARLSAEDRANIAMLDDPPRKPQAPRSPSAADAVAEAQQAQSTAEVSPCACSGPGVASLLPALVGFLALGRRRR